jgi:DNA-3-methyladenine glycosylase
MGRYSPLPASFYRRPAEAVARDLLGRYLVHRLPDGDRLVLRLVETEAYLGAPDRASHAWAGRRTKRNASLYLPAGHAYVYFIYGMHHCVNAVAGRDGEGGAVLLRAGEAVEGRARMAALRGLARPPRPGDLAGGPGRLCRALAIDRRHDGLPLTRGALTLAEGEPVRPAEVAAGPRVGVDYAAEAAAWPLRFAVRGHPEVSRPRW